MLSGLSAVICQIYLHCSVVGCIGYKYRCIGFIDNLHQIFALRCVECVGLQRRFEMCAKPDICTARLLSVEEELLSEESSPQIRSEEGFVGETWIGLCHPKERKIRFFCVTASFK